MGNYILRRLIYAVVTLMGISFISFLIVYAVPADPAAVIAGPNADAICSRQHSPPMGSGSSLHRPVQNVFPQSSARRLGHLFF